MFKLTMKSFQYQSKNVEVSPMLLLGYLFKKHMKDHWFILKIGTSLLHLEGGSFKRQCFTEDMFLGAIVQFSRSVVSDSLQPHESQHTRPPCPSAGPGVHSDSHPSSQ